MNKYKKEVLRIFKEYGAMVLEYTTKYNNYPTPANTRILDHLNQRYLLFYDIIKKR